MDLHVWIDTPALVHTAIPGRILSYKAPDHCPLWTGKK